MESCFVFFFNFRFYHEPPLGKSLHEVNWAYRFQEKKNIEQYILNSRCVTIVLHLDVLMFYSLLLVQCKVEEFPLLHQNILRLFCSVSWDVKSMCYSIYCTHSVERLLALFACHLAFRWFPAVKSWLDTEFRVCAYDRLCITIYLC